MDYEIAKHLGEKPIDKKRFPKQEKRITEANKDMLPKKDRAGQRAQHPRVHATVDATFHALDLAEADKDLAIGLFGQGSGRTHSAVVRFSNSRHFIDNPPKGDAHGMAIKIFGVEGEKLQPHPDEEGTFDFILLNSETFFDGDLASYANFNDLAGEAIDQNRNGEQKLAGIANGLAMLAWLKVFDRDLEDAIEEVSSQFPSSPLTETYWSTTPYLLGSDMAVKYEMAPVGPDDAPDAPRTPTYLQQQLREGLKRRDHEFILSVQIMDKTKGHSIEDPTEPWDGARKVAVAKLTIPRTDPIDELAWAALRFGREPLGYNIWNVTKEHRPLGAINRVRRGVYSELHRTRRDLDGEVYD